MLHIHRAERADGLVQALRGVLADPPADPFAPEVVAVPTRGMERWLTQRMSERLGATPGRSDGVCANVDFPPPRRVVGDAVATVSGIDPDGDAWLPERMVWPLLAVVDAALGEPWIRTLAAHLGGAGLTADPVRRARRFASVRHLAGLYDRYALHRPDMVRAWARGEDTDGAGRDLPADAAWQPELWRRLRARIAQPDQAERLEGACARLRARPDLLGLPERLALFGLTRLPAGHLEVLRAIAVSRDVHLFLLHPSPALWDRVAEAVRGRPAIVRRADDVTATLPANRLLASWGHDAREMQLVAGQAGEHADNHHPVEEPAGSLLACIQADVRADRPPAGAPLPGEQDARPLLDPADRSVQVHSCHGRARQVEVVRDAILHMLEEDAGLEPRDVIVMCPDIETFAPLVQATFGAGEVSGEDDELEALPADVRPPDLRVRLADRSLRQTNPVLGVVGRLIDMAGQRLTASEVLDLAGREPVRRRFHLDDDD
ncbi:MAG: exodeoxyribonuclease gamma subunit, partial [Solirubrobacteraceae bacterium]|nr:exodeoxyribonuclease gamma subunit [Solirubrobacteraceae bacterium]